MLASSKNRANARVNNLKRYMGKPCKYGHPGERYTRNGECCECKRLEFATWTKDNREFYNEYARNYYRALPPEKLSSLNKRAVVRAADWRKANPEANRASKKKHWHKNRERWRVYVRNRRARLAGIPGFHTTEDIIELRRKQNDRCKFCRVDLQGVGEADHITPVSRGGTNWPHNLQLLCMPCNRKKHAKDPVTHARAIGLLPPSTTPANVT